MTALLRQIALAEIQTIWIPRFNNEAAREGLSNRYTTGAIEASFREGAPLLVENADTHTVVYCHRETSEAATIVYVNFVLGLSSRLLDIFLGTTNALIAAGYATARFKTPDGAPATNYAVLAAQHTGAALNASGHFEIPLATARTRLIALGAT